MLDARLALVTLVVVPVVAVVAVCFQKRILAGYRTVRKTNSQITGAFNEGIMGARTTKTLVREGANFGEFPQLTRIMRSSSVRAAVLRALFYPIVKSGRGGFGAGDLEGRQDVFRVPGCSSVRFRRLYRMRPAFSSRSATSPASLPTCSRRRPRRSAW